MQIMDAPDMPNRGYYFDQTRGRILKLEELKKIADRMSLYKLNQLQLYVEHTYLFRDFSEMWRRSDTYYSGRNPRTRQLLPGTTH